jgi:hypothetical protein
MQEAVSWDSVVPAPRDVVRVESLADEALDLLDETPMGGLYYPYQAAALVSHACWGLGDGRGHERFLPQLRETAERYAKHLDWQLARSRIPMERDNWFQHRETDLWHRHTQLPVSDVESCDALAAFSRRTAEEYAEAISCALSEAATADFIVIVGSENRERLQSIAGRWAAEGDRRAVFDTCVRPGRMAGADRTSFDDPAFLYLWGADENEVADLLREAGAHRVLVDVRRPDGAVVDGAAFVMHPVKSVRTW